MGACECKGRRGARKGQSAQMTVQVPVKAGNAPSSGLVTLLCKGVSAWNQINQCGFQT